MLLTLYKNLMRLCASPLRLYLLHRQALGKEHPQRITERFAITGQVRPQGALIWVNAVSVGEAQAALILIDALRKSYPAATILVTTVTVTSAELMAKRLPAYRAIHQFSPVDHPDWVKRFLDHWQPDLCLWMESELWPCMLSEISARRIPCALVNAHMSARSFRNWQWAKGLVCPLLSAFTLAYAQSDQDRDFYKTLGLQNIHTVTNLKYAAKPLPYEETDLRALTQAIGTRPCWLFASTHAGEEAMAARLHQALKPSFPDLLTVIVPRHPARRDAILSSLRSAALKIAVRGPEKSLPQAQDDLFLVATLGELGLFYKACSTACIGRSFSEDGGGGHNPIEAAQLDCAVFYGPNVQNLQDIFDDLKAAGGARQALTEKTLEDDLRAALRAPPMLDLQRASALRFIQTRAQVVDHIMNDLQPFLNGRKTQAA